MGQILFPKGYSWKECKGIIYTNSKKDELYVSNDAMPCVLKRKIVINYQHGSRTHKVQIGYRDMDGIMMPYVEDFTDEEIASGKFIKRLPISIIIAPGFEKKAVSVFRFLIQQQLKEAETVEEIEYLFGWNRQKYYWGDGEDEEFTDAQLYDAAV